MSRIWQMSITETSLKRRGWNCVGRRSMGFHRNYMSKVGKPVLLVEVVEEEAVPLYHHSDGDRHAVLGETACLGFIAPL